jgi:hypothetical protein
MLDSRLVDYSVEEVMTDELMLERLEGMVDVKKIALVNPFPVDQVGTAGAASAALVCRHLPELLETVEIVIAVRVGAFNGEGRRFLKSGHEKPH